MDRLRELEAVIARGMERYLEVGRASATVRDEELFKLEFPSFGEYLRAWWGLSQARAYDAMHGAETSARPRLTGCKCRRA